MPLKTKVKVSNITNLSDARYCAGMGADLLGFQVNSATCDHDLKRLKEISSWVSGPSLVLEWSGDPLPQDILDNLSEYNVDYVEINVLDLESLRDKDIPLIVVADAGQFHEMSGFLALGGFNIKYLLLVCPNENADPVLIKAATSKFNVILGYGINESALASLLDLPIAGINLRGGSEDKPGLKEYSTLSGILERLQID